MTVNDNQNKFGLMSIVRLIAFIPRVLVPTFLVVATIFCGRAMGLAIYDTYFQLPDEMKVPKIVGKDVEQAKKILQDLGLGIDVQETRFSSKAKKDAVMEQYPPAGRDTREGSTISVVVSMGPDSVAIPKVIGMNFREAEVALHNAKLNVGKVTRVSRNKNDPESVLEQNPKPGQAVKKGAKVNLLINMGNVAKVKVPSFANQGIERVREQVGASNLSLGEISWVVNDSVEKGLVINQDPASDKEVAPGTEVNVRVSIGSATNHEEVKQRLVQVRTPDSAGLQEIRVLVKDMTGSYSAYEGTHAQGELINVYVTCMGRGEYEVYSNERQLSHGKI